jgi:hypothetical protein
MDNKEVVDKAKTIIVNRSIINTAGLITILLIILKVTNNIDISWLWVFAVYWLPITILLGFIGIILIGILIMGIGIFIWEEIDSRRSRW